MIRGRGDCGVTDAHCFGSARGLVSRDIDGHERWWDGAAWTEHLRAAPASTTATESGALQGRGIPVWAGVLIGVVAFGLVLGGGGMVAFAGAISGLTAEREGSGASGVGEAEAAEGMAIVPDVIGLTVADARVELEAVGLAIKTPWAEDDDIVATQLYSPGRELELGTEVFVTIEQPLEGSIDNPLPAGYPFGIWDVDPDDPCATITIAVKDPNADAAIAAASGLNDTARPGHHFVAVEYVVTAEADEPVWVEDLVGDWTLSQADGVQIPASDSVIVMPDGWTAPADVNDLYEGQTASAVVLYQVSDAYTGPLLASAYGAYVKVALPAA